VRRVHAISYGHNFLGKGGVCKNSFWYGMNDTFFDVLHASTITAKQLKLRDSASCLTLMPKSLREM
jgi:hypothetical protein